MDMQTVADPSSNRIIALLPRFLKQVSQVLRAEIALLLYARSPAADVVAFQFYAQGRSLDDCFARIGDPEINLIERLRQPKKLEKLLAGRFAWVGDYPILHQDAEEEGYESIDPYRHVPANAGLDLPFVKEHSMMPLGMLYYDLAQLGEKRAARSMRHAAGVFLCGPGGVSVGRMTGKGLGRRAESV